MKISSFFVTGAAAALVALASTSAMAGGCGTIRACGVKHVSVKRSCETTSICRTVVRRPVDTVRTTRVLVKRAETRLVREPDVYETRKERVMVRPAATTYRYVPPVYATREERVLIAPASVTYRHEAPVYRTVTRKHVSTACETRIERKVDCNGCVSSCRVSRPVALVHHTTERVLVSEGRRVAVHVPARYGVRKTLVEVKPGQAIAQHHPAEYINRTVHVKVAEGRSYRVITPAVYATRTERVRSSCGHSLLGCRH